MKKILILGFAGNCVDILEAMLASNSTNKTQYEPIGFLDDNPEMKGKGIHGVQVIGGLRDVSKYKDVSVVSGIGSPHNFRRKKSLIESLDVDPSRFSSVVHPSASVSPSAFIGDGSVILQNATVASNVQISSHVMILPNTVISHDDQIGSYSSIAGGACISGGVTIGESCYVGSRACLIGNISVGDGAMIGMGSVVIRDVQSMSTVVGNPANVIKISES